jgi:hypothetical protein
MKLHFYPYTLELKHTFTLATSSRTTTPDMMVQVEKDDHCTAGIHATYLGESQTRTPSWKRLISQSSPIHSAGRCFRAIDQIMPGNSPPGQGYRLHDWGEKDGWPVPHLGPDREGSVTSFAGTTDKGRQKTGG